MESNDKYEFIKETRREKPINKVKLLKKALVTIGLAILFGIVASICYTLGNRHIEDILYPKKLETVSITEEAELEETVPIEVDVEEDDSEEDEEVRTETVINNIVKKVDISVYDYEELYATMHTIAQNTEKSIVTVAAVDSSVDWMDNAYENSTKTCGLIVADNARELLILTDYEAIEDADNIEVEFSGEYISKAELKQYDVDTNLAIISIELDTIPKSILDNISYASFGNTKAPSTEGKAIIAIGKPLGDSRSVAYGFIASSSKVLQLTDSDVQILTTDILGSRAASGVIINLQGKVLGIITNRFTDVDPEGLISAYAISDLKPLIESMSNDTDRPYFGILGTDVNASIKKSMNIPDGAYVTEVIIDSPAMRAGIQSGDLIVAMGENEIKSFNDYKSAIREYKADDVCSVWIKRFARGEYTDLKFDISIEKVD